MQKQKQQDRDRGFQVRVHTEISQKSNFLLRKVS